MPHYALEGKDVSFVSKKAQGKSVAEHIRGDPHPKPLFVGIPYSLAPCVRGKRSSFPGAENRKILPFRRADRNIVCQRFDGWTVEEEGSAGTGFRDGGPHLDRASPLVEIRQEKVLGFTRPYPRIEVKQKEGIIPYSGEGAFIRKFKETGQDLLWYVDDPW